MAASYPSMLASGVDDLGRFDPFDLFAGEGRPVTSQGQAADGQAISQFQVLMMDAEGKYVPLLTAGDYATGTITLTGQPSDTETVTINGAAITFEATAPATATQALIGATATLTAQNLKDVINSDPELYGVVASGDALVLTLTAIASGTAGNAITLTEAAANLTVSGAGTLAGANAAEDVPSGDAVAIAAQPIAAATPGAHLPVFIGGGFNHEALIWPAGLTTLAQRKAAFAGTMIFANQLL